MRTTIKLLKIGVFVIPIFFITVALVKVTTRKNTPPAPLILTSGVINQQLPKSNLVTLSGQRLDDETLRQGKVVIAFMMPDCVPCDRENEFLKTVADSRKDVRFFYVIPFGNSKRLLESGKSKYSIEPAYDKGSNIARTLDIYQVPIKIFLEDGVIKRTWISATETADKQTEFKNWLKEI